MWRRDREALDRLDATIERARVSSEVQLQITREVIRRNELAFEENSRVLARLADRIERLNEESRAHTRAIFAMIDRLEGGSSPATS